MHYYNFHVGDYLSHTAHLKPLEDLAYRRLLDLYYSTEEPIPKEIAKVARLVRLPQAPVKAILDEFFTLTDEGYRNTRADAEILVYKGFSEAGKRGAAKRWSKGGDSPPIATPLAPLIATNNQEPITNNHKPSKNINAPEGVSLEVWDSFVQQRKKSRAVITTNVVQTIAKEAAKANWTLEEALAECAARGWRGFKAEWVKAKHDDSLDTYFDKVIP